MFPQRIYSSYNGEDDEITNEVVNKQKLVNDLFGEETRTDHLFSNQPISGRCVNILLNGYRKQLHHDLYKIFLKENILVRKVKGNSRVEAGFYVWRPQKCLWVHFTTSKCVHDPMVLTFYNIFRRCLHYNQITIKQAKQLKMNYQNIKFIKNICGYLNMDNDDDFEEKLNEMNEILPIDNCKKIDLRTKIITNRTYNDYFTYYMRVNYLPELNDLDNLFYRFNRSMWPNDVEFDYWRLLNGKIVTPDEHDNLCIVWEHILGGGGKTVWLNCLHQIFISRITKFTIDTFMKGGRKNKAFELCKLYGRTLGYCDENTKNKEKAQGTPKKTIDLSIILDISGGGMREDVDKYAKVSNIRARKQTATLLFAGNKGYFGESERISSLNRRLVMFSTLPYFRNPGEPDYDENNPYCGPKDPNLEKDLQDHPNHIFTYFVNCAYDFLMNRPDLVSTQPQRFKDYWKNKVKANHQKYEEKRREKLGLLSRFMKDACTNEIHAMKLSDFLIAFIKYCESNDVYNITMAQEEARIYFNGNNFGDPKIKVRYIGKKAGEPRIRMIHNLKPN